MRTSKEVSFVYFHPQFRMRRTVAKVITLQMHNWHRAFIRIFFIFDGLSYLFISFAGQSDIKKLRRENYQLRKEIWTLRDEHDRLGKLLRSRNCDGGGGSSYVGAGDSDADEKNAIDDDADDDYDYEYDDDYRCCSCHSNEVCQMQWLKHFHTIYLFFRFVGR